MYQDSIPFYYCMALHRMDLLNLVYSLADGHLSCQFWTIMNKAAMNINKYKSLHSDMFLFLFVKYLGVEWLSYMVSLWETGRLFHNGDTILFIYLFIYF